MRYQVRRLDRPGSSGRRVAGAVATAIGTAAVVGGLAGHASAASSCVSPGGSHGCYASIGAAVSAATAGQTIFVERGTYREDVTIGKSVSLVGDGAETTIIDATGYPNAITITGASNVVVSGFTAESADTAGIWIASSSFVTISHDRVVGNDLGLDPGTGTCPPLAGTAFEKGEALDCGEGVFLSAVDHSILADNVVTGNAGGILVADDTGPTHDNLITRNSVVHNTQLDCGITMPSHSGAGVFHNTVLANDSSYNGGPGVGIFAPGPGSKAYGNVVIQNRLRGNGLPGVTMHNHAAPGVGKVPPGAPEPIFNDNLIVGNDISENAQDTADAATGGPTGINIYSVAPMNGTVISGNIVHQEAFDIVFKVPAASGALQVHLNDLPGRIGLDNAGAAAVNATENWWGCSKGPGAPGCSTTAGAVKVMPWLTTPTHERD